MDLKSRKNRIGIATIAAVSLVALLGSTLSACLTAPKANVQVKVFKQ